MGSKRVGLLRTQKLLENLKREINLENTKLLNATVQGAKAESSGPGMVTASVDKPLTRIQNTNGQIVTTYQLDLTGLRGSEAAAGIQRVIGTPTTAGAGGNNLASGSAAYLFQWDQSTNGIPYKVEMSCIETPAGGAANARFVLSASTLATHDQGDDSSALGDPVALCGSSGSLAIGVTSDCGTLSNIGDGRYLYLMSYGPGEAAGGQYTAGKIIIRFYAHADF